MTISVSEAQLVHKILVEKFGGSSGVRDSSARASALARPYHTFEGKELYATAIEKAAALIESILSNHPFVDGNKRTGYVLMRLLLMHYAYDIKASQEEKYDFVIRIASGKADFHEITTWLQHHTTKLNGA